MERFDALIIGGGAAGLMCAVQTAWGGGSVLVIEHERVVAKKLRITGKGRCNVTNNCDPKTVLDNTVSNPRFMYSALSSFSPEDTMAFFEMLGVPLKTERGNRVFPVSDNANDIAECLINTAKQAGVKIVRENARELLIEDGRAVGVKCDNDTFFGKNIVVATGGKSYPKTGSTGDGYSFARAAGHTVTDITPSLVPMVTAQKSECAEMMGLSLRNVTLSLCEKGKDKPVYSELGEMLFTHFGVSGPLVLSASAHISDMKNGRYHLLIDLKPALDREKLDKRILRDFESSKNRDFSNSLGQLLPAKMIPVIIRRTGIDGAKKVNQLTRQERERLIDEIKSFRLDVSALRPIDEAIITRGGVDVREIEPKTMRSKKTEGLYFIGEVLDIDAYTGGFNLQLAFASAVSAAKSIMHNS
ncbi:MAG: NAD(P)/FAD-dependent oxidoreductase [Ruminococcus sp.]|nr:NAD(P)/FAD-dependent oxidoreductase [Ruminococcus sp.]